MADTICWYCRRACVSCRKPVPGWTAIRNDVTSYQDRQAIKIESYIVLACPNFEPDLYKKSAAPAATGTTR